MRKLPKPFTVIRRESATPEELEREHFDWNVATASKRKEKEKILKLEEVGDSVFILSRRKSVAIPSTLPMKSTTSV